jgi:hypothetical protein
MHEEERETMLVNLAHCKTMGEKAYDDMYDAHSFRDAGDCYRDAKDFFYEAISLAGQLGLTGEKEALKERLAHIKAVFRSQFAV